ncbi:hypothetical protein AB0910_30145 [Streptomyces sp. NPDC047002]|uniref:hypothetical protein n=1 Tax=Streptomyces sp. NPDC047002 TaxID=3155475 RepID=UPI003451F57D
MVLFSLLSVFLFAVRSTVRFALACLTAHYLAKMALQNTHSRDRAAVVEQLAAHSSALFASDKRR